MRAKLIEITTKKQLRDLRKRVEGGLFMNADNPEAAYVCGNCGNPLAFIQKAWSISGNSVPCPCGTINTL